jgi:hypothetical protein
MKTKLFYMLKDWKFYAAAAITAVAITVIVAQKGKDEVVLEVVADES